MAEVYFYKDLNSLSFLTVFCEPVKNYIENKPPDTLSLCVSTIYPFTCEESNYIEVLKAQQ